MTLILLSQLIITAAIITLVKYKQIFNSIFWLVCSIVLLAFIPNFITSLFLGTGGITVLESQILFSITGGIVLTFLYVILNKIKCN